MGSRGKRGLREREVMLEVRWRRWRRARVARTANSDEELRGRRRWKAARLVLLLLLL
jgi:hypothetical protein